MGITSSHGPAVNSGRDLRIDILRGLALITIFIDHSPANPWASYTMGNFGFSDAAEAFVLMSGIAAGLAYSRSFFGGETRMATTKIGRRVAVIYSAHVLSTIAVIVALLALSLALPMQALIKELHVLPLVQHPSEAIAGLFLLSYQLGYFNILPLYCVLLAALPFFLWLGQKSLNMLLGVSAALWLITHLAGLYMPGWPTGARWFLNPFGWQLLFVIGLMVGIRKKQGQRLVPYSRWLYIASVLYVLAALGWQLAGRPAMPQVSYGIGIFLDMGKSDLSFLRLLHILALGYVIAHSQLIGRFLTSRIFMPFCVMGQASLTTFVTGSLIAISLHMLHVVLPLNLILDSMLMLLGIVVQYGFAKRAGNTKRRAVVLSVTSKPGHRNADPASAPAGRSQSS
ncbi:OpgC domain-containing protein [uncultured Cohaesibacter sp.]|uniref:OpgC family protein n=1 Tax=uncultured Cohaesibacter sp. TaxID=1002546 RepID=UPI0029C6CD20|nr:OpgC domain-containing protein [uncultured Cohaesibacter sp.]